MLTYSDQTNPTDQPGYMASLVEDENLSDLIRGDVLTHKWDTVERGYMLARYDLGLVKGILFSRDWAKMVLDKPRVCAGRYLWLKRAALAWVEQGEYCIPEPNAVPSAAEPLTSEFPCLLYRSDNFADRGGPDGAGRYAIALLGPNDYHAMLDPDNAVLSPERKQKRRWVPITYAECLALYNANTATYKVGTVNTKQYLALLPDPQEHSAQNRAHRTMYPPYRPAPALTPAPPPSASTGHAFRPRGFPTR